MQIRINIESKMAVVSSYLKPMTSWAISCWLGIQYQAQITPVQVALSPIIQSLFTLKIKLSPLHHCEYTASPVIVVVSGFTARWTNLINCSYRNNFQFWLSCVWFFFHLFCYYAMVNGKDSELRNFAIMHIWEELFH